jgi:hypothetical protein
MCNKRKGGTAQMYCQYCGKENQDTNAFCTHCGKPLKSNGMAPGGANQPRNDLGTGQARFNETITKKMQTFKAAAKNTTPSERLKYFRIAYLVAAVVAIVSTFLPYLNASAGRYSYSTNFIKESETGQPLDGIFLLILAGLAILFWWLDKKVVMIVMGGIASALMLF